MRHFQCTPISWEHEVLKQFHLCHETFAARVGIKDYTIHWHYLPLGLNYNQVLWNAALITLSRIAGPLFIKTKSNYWISHQSLLVVIPMTRSALRLLMKNRTWETTSPRTQLLPHKSQPQARWEMEMSKANTTESTNPHVRKQRQKTSQNKRWEGDAAAVYLPQSVQGLVLSKERTSFELLWKTTLEAQPWHWKGSASQGSPVGTSCSRVAQTAAVPEQGGADSQCLTNVGNIHVLAWQACLRADQTPQHHHFSSTC